MSSVESSERQRLAQIIRQQSIKLGDFVLASGRRSTYYLDCRRTTLHPEGAYLVGRLTFDAIREESWKPQAVGGLTLGADPMSTATSLISFQAGDPWAAFIVRKESKQHGTGQRIEGCPDRGARVVLLEDVITSGGSALAAQDACVEAGLVVVGCVAIVDREEGGRAAIEARGVPVRALFTASELLG